MRRQYCPAEKRTQLEAWRASGLSVRAFAAQIGVSASTFAGWVGRLPAPAPGHAPERPNLPAAPAPTLARSKVLPEGLAPAPSTFVQLAESVEAFAVVIGDVPVRFSTPPPAAWFGAVLRELGRC